MALTLLRFASIMSTAVTFTASFAHLMELPAKMDYDSKLYVKLHRTLYNNFGRIAGIAEVAAVVTTGGLVALVRNRRPRAYPLTTAAAGMLAAAHATFWTLVHPANKTMISWPLEEIPEEWPAWRDQWEYSHAARALLVMGALSALVYSSIEDAGPSRREWRGLLRSASA